jgi:hypothetical protein
MPVMRLVLVHEEMDKGTSTLEAWLLPDWEICQG